jgi:hypothetical protein
MAPRAGHAAAREPRFRLTTAATFRRPRQVIAEVDSRSGSFVRELISGEERVLDSSDERSKNRD